MIKNPVLLYNKLVVVVMVLFVGIGIQPAFATTQLECIDAEFFEVTTDFVRIDKEYATHLTKGEIEEFDDLNKENIILGSFHDVGIKNITSPKTPCSGRTIPNFIKGSPVPEVFIQPGTESIDVTIVNNGTFPEYNLTCYVEIYEYITDPENGTLVYEDEITDIDLEEPNGGTKLLNFNWFTFADEGIYGLYIDLPLEIDDFPENNYRELIIGVDDTNPECDCPPIIDPPEPDGENGWFVSNITVTLNATDPWSNGVSSGVREIRYTVNGGSEQAIPGKTGSIVLTHDGKDILVKFWAIDRVGNVETPYITLIIDIDKTPPETSLIYEIVGGNWLIGWDYLYCFTVDECMSGVNVTYYRINGGEWMIYTEPFTLQGHVWLIEYYSIDNAGNVEDIKSSNVTISSNFYLFENLKLLNNYTDYIARFLIFAAFDID
jgi:hypothetical protein